MNTTNSPSIASGGRRSQSAALAERSIVTRPEFVAQARAEDRARRADLTPPRGLHVAVIGSGVIGLSIIQEMLAVGVTSIVVYSDRPIEATASYAAAGLIEPIAGTDDPNGGRLELDAFERSYRAWGARMVEQSKPLVFLREVTSYIHDDRELPWAGLVDGFGWLDQRELHPAYAVSRAVRFLTFVVDPPRWLATTRDELVAAGVRFVSQRIDRIDDLRADLIVNASGLGAHGLTGDHTLFRGDGHVVYVERPRGLREVLMEERRRPEAIAADPFGCDMLYSIPRYSDVVLGGTLFRGEDVTSEPAPIAGMGRHIYEMAVALEPRLVGARVLGYRAATRPRRTAGTRLEIETDADAPVLHCYGTGGSGWTLAPGLAQMAVELAAQRLWGGEAVAA